MKKYIAFIIIPIMIIGCKEQLKEVEELTQDFTYVEVADVEISNTAIPIFAIGRVASEEEIKLSFKIGGIISGVFAEEGQYVKEGKLLASLRTNEIDAQVLKARQALDKASRDLDRINKMYAEGAATLENVQDLTTLVQVSEADLEVAQFNRKYAQIVTPSSGRIIRKMGENGELVSPGQPIYLLSTSQSAPLIKASLSDRDVTKIKYGDKAEIRFDAYPDEAFGGKVLRISESSDPRTGTFEVEIEINSKGKRLRNGYIGRVEIKPKQTAYYYKIPIDALVEGDDDLLTVFVPSENNSTAIKVLLRPEYIGADYFTVSRGEQLDLDKVITSGGPYLLDGDKIQIK